jgi:hypothetical protein
MKRTLTLALKGAYFDQVKSGEKIEEYRLVNDYWRARLERFEYDRIVLTRGYPAATDTERRIELPWRGYVIKTLTHPEFGTEPVEAYAIRLAE